MTVIARVCPNCGPKGIVKPNDPTYPSRPWGCGQCGADLAEVEYVPSADLRGAVGALEDISDGLAAFIGRQERIFPEIMRVAEIADAALAAARGQ